MGNRKGNPTKNKIDDYTRLTNLNALVSLIEGDGACTEVRQLNVALEFLRSNDPVAEMAPISFEHCVSQVVRFHYASEVHFRHAHWDARRGEVDPLWLRACILDKVAALGDHPRALLIISGLRKALLPRGRRWTQRRERIYRESILMIESLAARQAHPGQRLSVLFI